MIDVFHLSFCLHRGSNPGPSVYSTEPIRTCNGRIT